MIGVFDSGSGGLTVLRAFQQVLPEESFVYLGDHGNAPYGNLAPETIYELTRRGVGHLFACGCPLVVLACNTAAATGLRQLQQTWLAQAYPQRRVLGVIVPVVEAITGVTWDAQAPAAVAATLAPLHVAVFATRHTVDSGAYIREITHRAPQVRVSQQACPGLVDLIEAGAGVEVLRAQVHAHVHALIDAHGVPDACVLGCTHYPLVEPLFVEALPPRVRMISQSAVSARSLADYLRRHGQFRGTGPAACTFLTTGDPQRASALATRFYGRPVTFRPAGTLRVPGPDTQADE